MKEKIGLGSFCSHELKPNIEVRPHQLPIYATSSFEFDDLQQGIDIFAGEKEGHVYGRYGNPTIDVVAEKIARLEGYNLDIDPSAIMFSSGMSAIATLFSALLDAGDSVVTQGNLYGGSTELLLKVMKRFGINPILTNLRDLDNVRTVLDGNPDAKLLYFETPANPSLACVDMDALCAEAQKRNITVAVDNTFCTPLLQQPFKFGVDYIIHSTTKFLNGHGNSVAGIIVGKDRNEVKEKIWNTMKLMGTNCNAFDAWLVHNGLKTLELRMKRHCVNGMEVARFLEDHPKVTKVNYVGLPSHEDHAIAKKQMNDFGSLLSFELEGGLEAGKDFMRKIEFLTIAPTLGDIDTLVMHPASMSHLNIPREVRERNGITDGLIRLSIGIENVEDVIDDLKLGLS